jgi:putative ABC transport system permease protein
MRLARAVWKAVTGTGGVATAGFGLLVLICVFLAVAAPRESLDLRTTALHKAFLSQPALGNAVLGTVDGAGLASASGGSFGSYDIATVQDELAANLRGYQLPLAGPDTEFAWLSSAFFPVNGLPPALYNPAAPQLEVDYRAQLNQHARLVAGQFPVATQGAGNSIAFQIAVSVATADRFSLHIGSRIRPSGPEGITMVVSGIIRPLDEASAYWAATPAVLAPSQQALGQELYWDGGGFIGPGELDALQNSMSPALLNVSWQVPLDVSSVNADGALALEGNLTRALDGAGLVDASAPLTVVTGLDNVLPEFIAQDATASAVLSLLAVSLTAIGVIVLLLGVQVLAVQRRTDFALLRSRGASRWHIALLALRAAALVTLPSAAVAIAVAVRLIPGYNVQYAWWLVGLTVFVALAGAPLTSVRELGIPKSRRQSVRRRLVAELTLAAAAVASLVVLRQQGVQVSGGNALASLAPVFAAVPIAIAVLWCYPVMVRALLRLARPRPGITAFVGFARAVQMSLNALLPAFALILAFAVVAFGAMIRTAVARGDVLVSWQQTGADAVINAAPSWRTVTPAVMHALDDVPGVQKTAVVVIAAGSAHGQTVQVVGVNPAQYAALTGATPLPPFPAARLATPGAGPFPLLASGAAASLLGAGTTTLGVGLKIITVRVAGSAPSIPDVPAGGFVVVPMRALGAIAPPASLVLMVGPHLDASALTTLVHRDLPGAALTFRGTDLAALDAELIPHSAYLAIEAAALAAGGLTVLVLLIVLVLGARSREPTLARLRVMGLGSGQTRWLVAAEALPQVAAAAIGGVACALVLGPLLGPSIDLSSFTGGQSAVPISADWGSLIAAVAGLLGLAVASLMLESVIAGRRRAANLFGTRE